MAPRTYGGSVSPNEGEIPAAPPRPAARAISDIPLAHTGTHILQRAEAEVAPPIPAVSISCRFNTGDRVSAFGRNGIVVGVGMHGDRVVYHIQDGETGIVSFGVGTEHVDLPIDAPQVDPTAGATEIGKAGESFPFNLAGAPESQPALTGELGEPATDAPEGDTVESTGPTTDPAPPAEVPARAPITPALSDDVPRG